MRPLIFILIVLPLVSCSREDDRLTNDSTPMPPTASANSSNQFWQWFESNLARFNNFEDDQEKLMDELSAQLHEIDENLVYEISAAKSGSRELIISADGIKESFLAVQTLTAGAPEIPGWKVVAFRPRVDITQFTLEYAGRKLDANDFYFWLQSEDQNIDLILYVPGLTEDNRNEFVNTCYVLLDMAIGEYDVATRIRYIDHKPLPTEPESERLKPLTELPSDFDELHAMLQSDGA